ncbi:MAG: branched-chain amino acid ABC transporter permease [Alphaproteobacteria bacterium]|nr:branched-chain amino acid ABC transporter permease [Alphaproteobacteria bacterium]
MDISAAALVGQLLIGLINGSAMAMLSLGLAVIFGLLNIINVTHGAQYMMGAFCAWLLLTYLGIGYWPALIAAPVIVGLSGIALERVFLRRVYKLDHIYGFLLTLGLSLLIEGAFRQQFGTSGQAYDIPDLLLGGFELGFVFLPAYRLWIIVFSTTVCFGTWFVIERTRLGATLRAATENPGLTQAFGINVPRMVTLTYGGGVALAALAGVMVAPIYQVGSLMGANILAVVFAVVVIGGLNSLLGAIVAGFSLGIIEGLTKVFYPQASSTVIFLVMVLVLLLKPAGLFGTVMHASPSNLNLDSVPVGRRVVALATVGGLALALAAPFLFYPLFVTQVLCYALFALSFNLLLGYGGLMSFGQAAFFGSASYVMAYTMKSWGFGPELGVLAGTAAATLLGAAFGWIAIRRQGIYFAMITFALAQIVYFYAVQAPWTEGENGIQAVPAGHLFGVFDLSNRYVVYYFVLGLFLFAFALVSRTVNSPFGRVLEAIRLNEPRAISLGYRVDRHKLLAFTLSAAIAGLAGSAKTSVFRLATLTDVEWTTSAQVVLITLVGGLGTLLGPVVGAVVIVGMQNYLAEFGALVTIAQGVVFVACVLMFRQGIVGGALGLLGRWQGPPQQDLEPGAARHAGSHESAS